MTKTIKIDGKEIVLKTNGVVPLLYKKEFKRDFFADIMRMGNDIDVETLFNLVWVFAKIGDSNIPDLWQWLEGFETIPIMDYAGEIMEMTTACISTDKKLKNKLAAAKH